MKYMSDNLWERESHALSSIGQGLKLTCAQIRCFPSHYASRNYVKDDYLRKTVQIAIGQNNTWYIYVGCY